VKFKSIAAVLLKTVLPIVVGMALLVLVVAWMAGVLDEKIEPGREEAATQRFASEGAEIYKIKEVEKAYIEEAVGTLKSAKRTEISAQVLAPIDRIYIGAGQTVAEGDVLVELDRRAMQTRLDQASANFVAAQASVQRAENDYNRAAKLIEKRVISQAEMDQTRADLQVAQANLKHAKQAVSEAEVMLSYTTIRAPKAGMIVDRLAEQGDMARPGEPLLILYDPASLRLEVPVMEKTAINLKVGDRLVVQIDALNNRRYEAVIDEIVPLAEATSRSLLVKVKLPPSRELVEGMSGRLLIPGETRRHLCIHTDAVQTIGQTNFVEVVGEDGKLERKFITVGRYGMPKYREVLSGLEAGDRVLLRPEAKQ
jgi:RND family efflux transporter MFP subunit